MLKEKHKTSGFSGSLFEVTSLHVYQWTFLHGNLLREAV